MYKSRLLANACRVVDKINILGTAYHAIKVVGIHRFLVRYGRHLVALAKLLWNERFGEMLAWKDAFVHRENNHIFEVEASSFEHTHYLQATERLAFESYFRLVHQSLKQEAECVDVEIEIGKISFYILLKQVLKSDCCKRTIFTINLNIFFCFNGLV